MGDGPVENLQAAARSGVVFDAVAGYVDQSGIGETYPAVVAAFPSTRHLSIATKPGSSAECGDVESGALSNWVDYTVGYCAVSNVNDLVARYGRPRKLWTAHYDPSIGAHICSPTCWPGLVTTADGTQWTNHGDVWDESLLADNFFDFQDPPAPPAQRKAHDMASVVIGPGGEVVSTFVGTDGHALVFTQPHGGTSAQGVTMIDLTDAVAGETQGKNVPIVQG